MYIINAKINTVTNGVIERGFLQIEDGKIAKVGPMEELDAQGEALDMHGFTVYPGFIDAHTHLGMWEDGLGFEGDDGNEETDPITPHLRACDAVNPMDRCFGEARQAGITTVVTGPGSANPISGQMLAMKTQGRRMESCIIKDPVAMKFALGENPKSVYHAKGEAPVTRMATAALIREQLYKARRYMEDMEKAQNDEDCDEPEYDMKCEALIPVLRREVKAHIHVHRADDMFTAIRLAKEFDLDYVLIHGTEGYKIADVLLEEGACVVAGPILCDRSKPELRELTPANPGMLSNCGVSVALCTDHPEIPIQYLPLCAGIAVKEGMDYHEALKAITISPAKICGIDDRVGSIEVGKDADLVVFAGDPFSVYAKPKMVMIDGSIIV